MTDAYGKTFSEAVVRECMFRGSDVVANGFELNDGAAIDAAVRALRAADVRAVFAIVYSSDFAAVVDAAMYANMTGDAHAWLWDGLSIDRYTLENDAARVDAIRGMGLVNMNAGGDSREYGAFLDGFRALDEANFAARLAMAGPHAVLEPGFFGAEVFWESVRRSLFSFLSDRRRSGSIPSRPVVIEDLDD